MVKRKKMKSNIIDVVVSHLNENPMNACKFYLSGKKIINETLPSNASSSDYIDDFVHSDNKMFKGDSKEKRIRRALGAYYGKKHSIKENAVEPLLGEDGKSKKKKEKKESGPDTPIQLNKGVPNRTSNYGERDVGQNI